MEEETYEPKFVNVRIAQRNTVQYQRLVFVIFCNDTNYCSFEEIMYPKQIKNKSTGKMNVKYHLMHWLPLSSSLIPKKIMTSKILLFWDCSFKKKNFSLKTGTPLQHSTPMDIFDAP